MISEYVLLCAPYRFENRFVTELDKEVVDKELLPIVLPNVNILTRFLVKHGLKKNFGIVNKHTLVNEIRALKQGDYRAVKNEEKALTAVLEELTEDTNLLEILGRLQALSKGKGVQGFDDCRIIDVLTKAYAGKLVSQAEFQELFDQETTRIKQDYESWEQYLASCVLGKILQFAPTSSTIVTEESFILAVYGYCLAKVNAFSFASFWVDTNLEQLGQVLADVLGFDYEQDKKDMRGIEE